MGKNSKISDHTIQTGKSIAQIRTDKGLKQDLTAYDAELSKTTMSKLENGTTDPRLSTIEKVAAALGVEPVEIFLNARNIQLDLPIPLQEIVSMLRHEDNDTLEAVKQQIKTLLSVKSMTKK